MTAPWRSSSPTRIRSRSPTEASTPSSSRPSSSTFSTPDASSRRSIGSIRDGGLVYAETPFLRQVHAGPYDFVRFTASGHRYLFRRFEEVAAGPVAGPGTQLLWSVDHLVRGVARSELAGRLARALLFALRYLDRIVPEEYAVDDASAFYFLGRRADDELSPHEIIAYYGGAQHGGDRRPSH